VFINSAFVLEYYNVVAYTVLRPFRRTAVDYRLRPAVGVRGLLPLLNTCSNVLCFLITAHFVNMVFKCSAYGSRSGYDSQATDKTVTFHAFPSDPEIRRRWITANPRKDFVPTQHSRICSLQPDGSSKVLVHGSVVGVTVTARTDCCQRTAESTGLRARF